jgi:Flp pilus assembly protein TadD
MTRTAKSTRLLSLAASSALATMALAGCATQSAPRADFSANRAEVALKSGKTSQAISHGEAAVLADPRNAACRAMLGAAYLEAGRFQSAQQTFDDAMKLGDESPRTALGYALAAIGAGDKAAAMQVLTDWQDEIPAADLGLALALAGAPDQGAHVLSNAIRNGDNTPKTRQNLAYTMALGGNWTMARIMAAEDVPAGQLDARIGQWAALARPEESQNRVATLLGTRVVADSGQPTQLALANHPTADQLAAEAAAYAPPVADAVSSTPAPTAGTAVAALTGELPALDASAPMPVAAPVVQPLPALAVATPSVEAPHEFEAAFATPGPSGATPAQMIAAAVDFAAKPVVQQTPTRLGAATRAPRPVASRSIDQHQVAAAASGHLVQLGSFSSEAGARRAWGIYAKRFAQLSSFDMVITRAVVRGKTYYRVSAGGMDRAEASGVCSSVRGSGQGCIAWSAGRPLPGAVDSGVRMASR